MHVEEKEKIETSIEDKMVGNISYDELMAELRLG